MPPLSTVCTLDLRLGSADCWRESAERPTLLSFLPAARVSVHLYSVNGTLVTTVHSLQWPFSSSLKLRSCLHEIYYFVFTKKLTN